MIVTVEVFWEVMVIIDMVDNQYTARGVHKGEGGEEDKQLLFESTCSLSNSHPSLPTDPQTVDGKVPAIPHHVKNCSTTNLVGGWKQAILPTSSPHDCSRADCPTFIT